MYDEFLQKFSANPTAAPPTETGSLPKAYQQAGNNEKALECGEKALARAPHNIDILVTP